jgi:EmrB/QacA subfamily drug resistance transporter
MSERPMPNELQTAGTAAGGVQADPRRWKALIVLGLVQFMLVLDVTVVNVALPSIQRDLGFSHSGLAWVVNGYVLMAGGFLLLGGRLADLLGRRRLFLIGVAIFAVASATSGAAISPGMLVASRFIQGLGQALAAPASLGLIALLFPEPRERIKALGMWGGVAGLGGTTGTIISGVLTNYASWRWIFYINLPVAAFALLMVPWLVSESRMQGTNGRPDFAGAVTATAGLVAIVDGSLNAATHAWGSWPVLLPLLSGVALLGLMLLLEARSSNPLIPLSFFTNRTRVVTNFTTLFFASAFFSYFFMLTLYEQQVLHWTPVRSGLSYLPFGISIAAGIALGTALMPRLGVKPILTAGFFGGAAGLWLSSDITVHTSYDSGVMPAMAVLGFFSGICFPAMGNASLHQVTGQDSSLASGVQSAMQQIGGALGLSLLVTMALRRTSSQILHDVNAAVAQTHGYVLAYRIAGTLMGIGGVLVLILLQHVNATPRQPALELEAADVLS